LREGEAGERGAGGGPGDFHLDGGRVGCSHFRRTEGGVLAEDFVVDLGDEVVLAGCILAPDLSELNGFHGHWIVLGFLIQTNGGNWLRQSKAVVDR
jgi:hypothetical protein